MMHMVSNPLYFMETPRRMVSIHKHSETCLKKTQFQHAFISFSWVLGKESILDLGIRVKCVDFLVFLEITDFYTGKEEP